MAVKEIIRAMITSAVPASVTIDVYEEDGNLLDTIPNGDIVQVGALDLFQCDVRGSSVAGSLGLPKDGEHLSKDYTFVWNSSTGSPVFTSFRISGVQDRVALDRMFRKETPVYPSTTVPARGITSAVIFAGKPSYIKVELSPDIDDFGTPIFTYFEIFYYNAQGLVETRLPSSTPPSP